MAKLKGTLSNDRLTATSARDTIEGLFGDDTLDGGAGADYLVGGQGNDVYYVDNLGDIAYEAVNEGIDTVYASINWTLGANLEHLVLTGFANLSGTGNALDNYLTGNSGTNLLMGGTGNDTLDGGLGADRLDGGAGDDTYLVDNSGDLVVELSGGGTDTVIATISHLLAVNVENLILGGSAAINGTGNAGSNRLTGNAAANVLNGSGGGVDTLVGLGGDDTYVVDSSAVIVVEAEGGGRDTVQTALTGYVLGDNVENLVLTSTANLAGSGNALDNILTGNAGANTLYGGDGNDTLDGGVGADSLVGGAGDDSYVVDDIGDAVVEGGSAGIDTVRSSIAWTLGTNLERLVLTGAVGINGTGNALANQLTGNAGANVLDGGAGADTLAGLAGDDSYVVDDVNDIVIEAASAGTDLVLASVDYTLADNVENLTLTGAASLAGSGNAQANRLTGNSGANTLSGAAGDDTLDGGAGVDRLVGGLGNDSYLIDSATDELVEVADEGIDTVQSSVSYTLADHIENLILTGSAALAGTGNALDNRLTGNSGANTLTGGAGNDTLDGGAGADSLVGGLGDDIYIIDSAGDSVVEASDEGNDSVQSSISYTLGSNVEHLTLTGSTALIGTGNDANNRLTGNSGSNTLTGGAGNDTLDGGAGTDSLVGGLGDDIYIIDSAGDSVVEASGDGNDSVQSAITYTLGSNVEHLTLTGSTALSGTGNDANNRLTGNSGANTLTGGSGNDTLDGGAGADSLVGGVGDDTYYVDNVGDKITESGTGTDTVISSIGYTLASNLEHLTLVGNATLSGTGNAADNYLTGNNGNNRLDGKVGNDTLDGGAGADNLIGGAGNDVYIVDNVGDKVSETSLGGTDTVLSSMSYTLAANVENLVLTGTGNLDATGNTASNALFGNDGDNRLDGRAGADYLAGGDGNDTYVVDQAADQIVEAAGKGRDKVLAAITYALAANVEDLTLTGTGAISGTGNELTNYMVGNLANNLLNGGAGNDTLDGAGGKDSLVGGAGQDSLLGDLGDDTLDGGDGDDTLYGGLGVDSLTGGAGNDYLSGDLGNDTLTGGAGSDTFAIDWGLDTITDLSTGDVLLVASGASVNATIDGHFVATVDMVLPTNSIATLTADPDGSLIDMTLALGAYTLVGGAGNDTLIAGVKNDSIRGGAGADSLYGGAGDDWFRFDTSDVGSGERLDGAAGTDVVYVTSSTDFSGLATVKLLDVGHIERLLIADGATATFTDAQLHNQALVVNTDADTGAATLAIKVAANGVVDLSRLLFADADGLSVDGGTVFHAFEQTTAGDKISIDGSTGTEKITGTTLADSIAGDAGNDTIDGGLGIDTILGGAGDDQFFYIDDEALNLDATVDGGEGDDTIVFSTSTEDWGSLELMDDDFANLAANSIERIMFADGNDQLDLGTLATAAAAAAATSNLTVEGGGGNDVIDIEALGERVTVDGGAGNDSITGVFGVTDSLIGGYGDDIITGYNGNDVNSWDYVDGGDGDDTLIFGTTTGTGWRFNGGDTWLHNVETLDLRQAGIAFTLDLNGTQTEGFIIIGSTFNDSIVGGLGADSITGGVGNDTLTGDTGADTLLGEAGNDILFGAQGDVLLDGGEGADELRLGAGFTDTGDSQIQGIEKVVLTASGLTVSLASQGDQGAESFVIIGYASGASTVTGSSGADSITGGTGNDSISAGAGADTITGGLGADTLNLGSDSVADSVIFTLAETGGADRISGFVAANDIVRFDAVLKAGNGSTVTTIDLIDQITSSGYQGNTKISALTSSALVYNFTTSILSKTVNGNILFSASTDAAIISVAEAALEDSSGLLSGTGVGVVNGGLNTDLILAFSDGTNVALLRYQEGTNAEADYSGELTLVGVLNGVSATALSDANFFA